MSFFVGLQELRDTNNLQNKTIAANFFAFHYLTEGKISLKISIMGFY